MFYRKNQEEKSNVLPAKWSNEVKNILESTYQEQCDMLNKKFVIYGETYRDEIVIAASLLDKNNEKIIPITYFISADLDEKEKPSKLIDDLIDSMGIFFDSYFYSVDWDEYQSTWQETNFKKRTFYYKVTRENIELTLLANKLLSEPTN